VSSKLLGNGATRNWSMVGVVIILLVIVWRPGCRTYPAVSSREGMQLIKRLCTVCNSRDPAKLAVLEKDLGELAKSGKITESEKSTFDAIIAMGRAGKWEKAEKAALQLADDQVGNRPPAKSSP
jgi:hypothetical protein